MKKEIIRQKISDIFEGHLRKLKLTEYAFCVILPEEKKWKIGRASCRERV